MKILSALLSFLGICFSSAHAQEPDMKTNFYDLSAVSIDNEQISMRSYEGKVVLIVNVASRCGFTSQYEALEAIYNKYRDRGLVILAFPSNDFMGQEPGDNSEIKKFCSLNYNVTFPLFSKAPVTGDEKQPIFKFLTEEGPKDLRGRVWWNFEKFIINRKGELVDRFKSTTAPDSEKITKLIESLL